MLKRKNHWVISATAGIILLAVIGQHYIWGRTTEKQLAPKALPLVTITTTQRIDLPIEFSAQGHLVTLNQVDVRPQITGIIRSVNFHEGDQVQAGQLLFTLDASDASAQINRYNAQSAQIKALLADAQRDYVRSKELVKSGFISDSTVTSAQSKVEALQAQLNAASAETDSAKIQAGYTRITAPVSGLAGAISIHPGSLAQTSSAIPLVTLVQMDPIAMEFNLPEQALPAILAAREQGKVSATLETQDKKYVEGYITFVNNSVSQDTGTISLKASFANTSRRLWPGGFARIVIHAGISKAAVVLPPQAVLEGPAGRFVYLLGDQNKVRAKPVNLLRIQDGKAVLEGLYGDEQVVLEGGQNLSDGAVVMVDRKTLSTRPGNEAGDKAGEKVGKSL
ncbi:efflux RND transporter periplasmic adaptor subunit [Undibacterium sp. CY18W]|uniref:Efflux RND transporter periplasmic adaptor subunit n=1 Tax=Undibacterium hunanense TaxID=2762292 RepID=A0ABR6ZMQ7_9BURK|nr:efflux RND transporter periplasmic adaptor subunit [Undibacterium hunanense]MBC3917170.1 efflux RND transporter periplasmic adaptor subunit [Undibacterium hunanense]